MKIYVVLLSLLQFCILIQDVSSASAVTVACSPTGMVITSVNADFGDATQAYSWDTCSQAVATLTGKANDVVITLVYATDTTCFDDSSSILTGGSVVKAGVITSKAITYLFAGANFDSALDESGVAACTYAFPDTDIAEVKVHGATFTAVDVGSTETKTYDITSSTTMTLVNQADGAVILESAVAQANTICVVVETTSADVVDINLKSFTFLKASGSTAAADIGKYIVDYCVDETLDFNPLMEALAAHTGTACVASGTQNCDKKRFVCFKPFKWAGESDLYVKATVTPEQASGYNTHGGTCSSTNLGEGMGRKKRETEQSEETISLEMAIPFIRSVLSSTQKSAPCETSSYMIASIVFGTAFLFMSILTIFAYFMLLRKKVNPMA